MNPADIARHWADTQWTAQTSTRELDDLRARQLTQKREDLRQAIEAAWEEPEIFPTFSAERHNAAALYRLVFGRGIES